jgi:hypothetical protein
MIRSFITILFIAISFWGVAQINYPEAEVMIQSRHIWRGTQLGNAPAIEPSVTFLKGHFSLNVWTSVTTNNSYSEIDLIPAWQFGELTVTVLDYYNPVLGEKNQFLNFQEEYNRHSLELTVDNYSGEKHRLKWLVGTLFVGDKNEETGNPFYSTYLELKYPFSFLKIDTEPFVGLTPFKGYYAEKLAVINSGIALSKELKLSSNLSIPIILTYTYNPYEDKQFITLGSGIVFSSGE